MPEPFLQISRVGSKVTLRLETKLSVEASCILFEWETGREIFAALLEQQLRANYIALLEQARKDAYLAGYKDGRGKKPKRCWWPSWLGWGYQE